MQALMQEREQKIADGLAAADRGKTQHAWHCTPRMVPPAPPRNRQLKSAQCARATDSGGARGAAKRAVGAPAISFAAV